MIDIRYTSYKDGVAKNVKILRDDSLIYFKEDCFADPSELKSVLEHLFLSEGVSEQVIAQLMR